MRVVITGHNGQLGRQLVAAFAGHEMLPLDLPADDITDPRHRSPHRRLRSRPDRACRGVHRRGRLREGPRAGVPGECVRHAERGPGQPGGRRGLAPRQHQRGLRRQRSARPTGSGTRSIPSSIYARSKGAAEHIVQALAPQFYIVRVAWLFGPGREQLRHQDPGGRGEVRRAAGGSRRVRQPHLCPGCGRGHGPAGATRGTTASTI